MKNMSTGIICRNPGVENVTHKPNGFRILFFRSTAYLWMSTLTSNNSEWRKVVVSKKLRTLIWIRTLDKTRRFNTTNSKARCKTRSWASSTTFLVQPILIHLLPFKLPFPKGFPTKTLYACLTLWINITWNKALTWLCSCSRYSHKG
jgi:hypothetical protein